MHEVQATAPRAGAEGRLARILEGLGVTVPDPDAMVQDLWEDTARPILDQYGGIPAELCEEHLPACGVGPT